MTTLKTGIWNCTSGILLVTDPCMEKGPNGALAFQVALDSAVRGKWTSLVTKIAGRNAILTAWSDTITEPTSGWARAGSIGVDSGQAGIFDFDSYPEENLGDYDDKNSFYGKACEQTLSSNRAGVVDEFGVVSNSGWGDGFYECMVHRDADGFVDAVKLDFEV